MLGQESIQGLGEQGMHVGPKVDLALLVEAVLSVRDRSDYYTNHYISGDCF